jgi:hypothetical protein
MMDLNELFRFRWQKADRYRLVSRAEQATPALRRLSPPRWDQWQTEAKKHRGADLPPHLCLVVPEGPDTQILPLASAPEILDAFLTLDGSGPGLVAFQEKYGPLQAGWPMDLTRLGAILDFVQGPMTEFRTQARSRPPDVGPLASAFDSLSPTFRLVLRKRYGKLTMAFEPPDLLSAIAMVLAHEAVGAVRWRTCLNCGTPFNAGKDTRKLYCSRTCTQAADNLKRKDRLRTVPAKKRMRKGGRA